MNLIGNAIKYNPDRELARRGRRQARDGDVLGVLRRDNGVGIAPEFHERIWGLFQTLEAARQGREHGHRARRRAQDRRSARRQGLGRVASGRRRDVLVHVARDPREQRNG